MPKNQNAFIKKQKTELKRRKKQDKLEQKLIRKAQPKDGSLNNMIIYVDEFGNLSETPPQDQGDKQKLNYNRSLNADDKHKNK